MEPAPEPEPEPVLVEPVPFELEPFEPPPTEPLEVLAPDDEPPFEERPEPLAPMPEQPAQPEPAAEPEPTPEPVLTPEPVPDPDPDPHLDPEPDPEAPAAPSSRLGTPPPPISPGRRRSRSAARRAPVAAVGAARPRRTGVSRLAALIALGAVLVAIVVAVVSLSSKSGSKPVPLPAVVNVLIPEGKTRVQISLIAKADGLKGSYRKASEHSALLDPTKYGAPKGTPDLEGFLFPATYELNKGAPALRLVEEQLAAFGERFGPHEIARAKALHVTPYGMLTVASMVEREAQVPGDRAKIAAVIYNRLAKGIPLGIDATIYYAVELEKNVAVYTQELTESQLQINSPYNTRTHTGLPPTPISNPGAASIEAAAHPADVPYLYYVAAADGCGEQVFSESQATFEANVAAYKTAVEKNGGKPPTCKKK